MRCLLALPVLALAAGCTSIQSSNLKTAGMSAQMTVSADGSGQSTAVASLYVGNSITDYVDLSAGDVLSVTTGGHTAMMAREEVLSIISYQANFSGADAENTQYTIAFTRQNDTSAPSSTCTMPKPFMIMGPTSVNSFSRAKDDITVTYSNAGGTDAVAYSLRGDCINDQIDIAVAGDPGTFTIARAAITPAASSNTATMTCAVTLTMQRTRKGTLDGAYGSGGSIRAVQSRIATFNSAP